MPSYIARRIQDQLNDDGKPLRGSLVLLLGVTYKPDIGDTRQSPAIPLAKALIDHGATLRFHDPLVKQFSVSGQDVPRVDHVDEALGEADICVLLQNHREYDVDAMSAQSRRFFDTRGVARPAHHVQLL
jgi:UDP-N-acetyl-D-mannosaminuronate dehydrogenase